MIDKRIPRQELLAQGFDKETVDKIIRMIKNSEFKRTLPPIAKISERSVGHDFLYAYDRDR